MSHNITVKGGTSVRLPTAGKYCDRDIIVTAEGGGIELNVVTASALPGTVVDGQIVVITDTAPGTVYIDTDEPASPAIGDLWIAVAAGGDAVLELTEEAPYLRNGLTEANQWEGGSWARHDGYLGAAGVWQQFAFGLPPVGTALNDMSWEDVSKISSKGLASSYFAVGDAKEIKLDGKAGQTTFANTIVWAFIIGIDHNSDLEGTKRIHFQLGKTARTGGKDIAFVDNQYSVSVSAAGYFNMNQSDSNAGGWASSKMRTALLGSSSHPSAPTPDSLMSALPSDLRAVMKSVMKYTDNKAGGSDTASYVTPTEDYLWLLSEYEVLGKKNFANSAEQNTQQQYAYYGAGNSAKKYKHNAPTVGANWWLRSAHAGSNGFFCFATDTGSVTIGGARACMAVSPAFCV